MFLCRPRALVLFVALTLASGVSFAVSVPIAHAATATTTSVSASPDPAVAGQPVTLTATTSAPGTVTFTYNGQTVGTSTTSPAGAAVPATQTWSFTGNSSPTRLATDSNNNIYLSTWNPSDCGGGRCQTKQVTPGGAVNYAPSESWNGTYNQVTGLAVASDGTIYEAVYGGAATNTIRKRSSIGATSTVFVPSSAGISRPTGMTLDSSDNLYVTSSLNGTIFKITPDGVLSTYASGLGNAISGPVMNKTTGVLYFINGSKDIMQIPAGGGTATLLADADCHVDPTTGDSYGGELAIDSSGNIYGGLCGGLSPSGPPNHQPVSQINPSTGAMREFLSWPTCMNGSLPNWAAGCNGYAIAFIGNKLVTAGASMGESNVMVLGPSGYIASITITPSTPGSFSTGASFAPSDAVTYSGSSGSGTLVVRPAPPSTPDLAASSDLGSSSIDNRTSDNTPLIEVPGTYTTGDTITVMATKAGSSNVTCSYVIPATGCSLGTLADGTWSITATDTHPTGGTSSASSALSVDVDTAAPAAPTGVDLLSSSDSGASSTDDNTSDSTPTFSVTGGAAGDTITITATKGSTTISCSYAFGSATNCTMGEMGDGTWSVTATLTDAAGNTSTAATTLPVRIDSTGPSGMLPDLETASDTGTSSTDNLTYDSTPTISITGQSTGDVVTLTASKSGAADATCSYTVGVSTSCTLPALSDGTWSVSASITDLAGNTGMTQQLSMTVDSTPPAAPPAPDLLPASDTGSSSTDNVTNDATPAISGLGAADGDTVAVTATKSGGGTVTCSYVKSASVNSCDLPTMTDGSWAISTTNTDPAGNVSPSSTPLNMTLDTVAPSAPAAPDLVAASDTGTSNSDNLTSDSTPSMSGGFVPDGSTVTINGRKADGSTVSCSYVASSTVTSCDLPTMSDGTWSMSATVADPAGNVSTAGPSLDISIDATPPSAPSTPDLLPASDSGTSNTDNITSDSTPDVSIPGAVVGDTVAVVATSPTGKTVICTYVLTATVSSCTLGTLTDGSWKVVGTVTDPAGNTSPASGALDLTIDTTAPSPVAPDLLPASDNGASNSDNLTNDATPAFGLPGAADGDVVSIVAKKDDGTMITCSFTKSATVSSCDLQTLTDGNWSVNATVADAAGNRSSAGPSMSLVIDTKPPAAPATPTVPTNTAGQTGDPTPTLDVGGVTAGDTFTGTATNGSKSVSCVFVGAPGVRSCDLPLLTPGQWFISATVTDPAGNTSAASPQSKVEVVKVGLPANAASLKSVALSGTQGSVTATATLKSSELGKVANVVFVVKNADGTIARTLRVAAPTRSTAVATAVKGLVKGQRVSAYTENWLGVSASAPRGANVIRAATVSTYDKTGRPNLTGARLLVSRIIFDPASPVLDDADKAQLDRIVWTLVNKGGLVLISGFARQNQSDSKNFLDGLSVDRAEAVANYLSARGVRAWIRFQGYGAVTRRIGTWEDRKVEIRWVNGATELPGK
jgi:outer membrane protein OmpA-like peptidoglycan-associated protein